MPFQARLSALLVAVMFSQSSPASPEPPNVGLEARLSNHQSVLELFYAGKLVYSGRISLQSQAEDLSDVKLRTTEEKGSRGEITQKIVLDGPGGKAISISGRLSASEESFPAETLSPAQSRFKMVRNSIGLSHNLRNNSIYERHQDWLLEGDGDGQTTVLPIYETKSKNSFKWTTSGTSICFTFRPRYYQKHKNLTYFRPWEYKAWKGDIAGWCSWWAYFSDVREQDVELISSIFADKLKDFGYTTIQIDDGYQSSNGGLPNHWLNTNDRFPKGLTHLSKSIAEKGLKPALWLNVHFGDTAYVEAHKDWFIQDPDGRPHKGPWIDYGLDGSNKQALDAVVRPTYRALHSQGWDYIKVDALRHLLYDSSYPSKQYFAKKGVLLEDAYRSYLQAIRDEVGSSTYMLACWGVLPEVIGIANGCRLGGDGFGPSTLQQYTSWNNVVWRNDPDHCDIKPHDHRTNQFLDGEERIRPVLVSMAGAQLLLSDRPDVYQNDSNLEGVKRSGPIPFTLPGQMYDFDPVKTDHLKQGLRNDKGGAQAGPIDADQNGEVCPWWMLDISKPYENWTVLARMNWHDLPMEQTQVQFSDLGLKKSRYSVFEFWSKKYLGDFDTAFTAKSLASKDVANYSIRETLDHPQVLSTSRHITQGAVEIQSLNWNAARLTLSGTSKLIRKDPYSIFVRLPKGYQLRSAVIGGSKAEVRIEDEMAEVKVVPELTKATDWQIEFVRQP